MKRWLVGALVALLVIVLLVGVLWIGGSLLPVDHVATSRASFDRPPEAVWEEIADLPGSAAWRSGIDRVERLSDRRGRERWREHGDFGPMTYEILERVPPHRLVLRIAEPDAPFGGSWTFEVEPQGNGAALSITEEGEVHQPLFRFLSRYMFGHHRTIEGYLRDLGARLGDDDPSIERVR